MKNMKYISTTLISVCLLSIVSCYSSRSVYVAQTESNEVLKGDTLIDKECAVKFILDTTRTYITAIDNSGKQLWKTNPTKDGIVPIFGNNRTTIGGFRFIKSQVDTNGIKKDDEVIGIGYSNHCFGVVNKKTGEFVFIGSD